MEIVEGGKGYLPNRISYKKRTWNAPDIQKLSPQLYIPVVHFRTYCMFGVKKRRTWWMNSVRKPMRRSNKDNNLYLQ